MSLILLVDDSPTARSVTKVHLMGLGHDFVEASCAETALDLLRQQPISLVVTDLNMPGMGGLGLVRALRAEGGAWRRLPVVLLSTQDAETTAAAAGASGFVKKPVSGSGLREIVSRLLG
jgi:CheY-like chemotaxis protein